MFVKIIQSNLANRYYFGRRHERCERTNIGGFCLMRMDANAGVTGVTRCYKVDGAFTIGHSTAYTNKARDALRPGARKHAIRVWVGRFCPQRMSWVAAEAGEFGFVDMAMGVG